MLQLVQIKCLAELTMILVWAVSVQRCSCLPPSLTSRDYTAQRRRPSEEKLTRGGTLPRKHLRFFLSRSCVGKDFVNSSPKENTGNYVLSAQLMRVKSYEQDIPEDYDFKMNNKSHIHCNTEKDLRLV